jgi:2-aminobenzoate-CoA ligase
VQDGWNLTGDAFSMDADGYFFYQARTDDMIISAGYNIAGPEVERRPARAPGGGRMRRGRRAGRRARPDRQGRRRAAPEGHTPGEALARELQDFVKRTIAPYKYPRAVEFVDALPRTETGKLQRFRLRQQS